MSFLALVGPAVSVLGTGVGAYFSSKSQKDANATNRAIADETNRLKLQLFRESRGSEGNAILPLYFGSLEGQTVAPRARELFESSLAFSGSPTTQLNRFQDTVDTFNPSFQEGNALINNIFSGALTNQRLKEAEPIKAARINAAKGAKQSVLQGVQETLNRIRAERSRGGVSGPSTFDTNRVLQASIGARQNAANLDTLAQLENALTDQQIRDSGLDLAIRSLDVPLNRARQSVAAEVLPTEALADLFRAQLTPFDYFRLLPQAGDVDRPPLVSAVPGLGEIIATGIGQGAKSYADYQVSKNIADRLINSGGSSSAPFTIDEYYNIYGRPGVGGGVLGTPIDVETLPLDNPNFV